MTKEQAIYSFFSSFGLSASQTNAPNKTDYPYITYDLVTGAYGDMIAVTANVWYYGTSEVAINAKVAEITKAVGLGGKLIACDGGGIWITRGTPWCQAVADTDPLIKRRYLIFNFEFIVND